MKGYSSEVGYEGLLCAAFSRRFALAFGAGLFAVTLAFAFFTFAIAAFLAGSFSIFTCAFDAAFAFALAALTSATFFTFRTVFAGAFRSFFRFGILRESLGD